MDPSLSTASYIAREIKQLIDLLFVNLSIYIAVCLIVCLSVSLSVCPSVNMYFSMSDRMSVCLSLSLCVNLSMCQSVNESILFLCWSTCMLVFLVVNLSVYLYKCRLCRFLPINESAFLSISKSIILCVCIFSCMSVSRISVFSTICFSASLSASLPSPLLVCLSIFCLSNNLYISLQVCCLCVTQLI